MRRTTTGIVICIIGFIYARYKVLTLLPGKHDPMYILQLSNLKDVLTCVFFSIVCLLALRRNKYTIAIKIVIVYYCITFSISMCYTLFGSGWLPYFLSAICYLNSSYYILVMALIVYTLFYRKELA